jgi:hypothetical protein
MAAASDAAGTSADANSATFAELDRLRALFDEKRDDIVGNLDDATLSDIDTYGRLINRVLTSVGDALAEGEIIDGYERKDAVEPYAEMMPRTLQMLREELSQFRRGVRNTFSNVKLNRYKTFENLRATHDDIRDPAKLRIAAALHRNAGSNRNPGAAAHISASQQPKREALEAARAAAKAAKATKASAPSVAP